MDAPAFNNTSEWGPRERAILNLLRGALEYPATVARRGTKLANDVTNFCLADVSDDRVGGTMFEIWGVWLEAICSIPHGHEWQQCLARAIDLISMDERASGKGRLEGCLVLPEFSMSITEQWQYKPMEGQQHDAGLLGNWCNLNSFMSLLVGRGLQDYVHLPLREIESALEEPLAEAPLNNCRVWVAAEYIANCADALKKEMKRPCDEVLQSETPPKRTGKLCDDTIAPRSVQRWDFWKKRLIELARDADEVGLREETKKRVEEASKAMESEF